MFEPKCLQEWKVMDQFVHIDCNIWNCIVVRGACFRSLSETNAVSNDDSMPEKSIQQKKLQHFN